MRLFNAHKKLSMLAGGLLLLASCNGSQADKATTPLQVMTFNIRLDTPSDSLNNWQYRKDNATKLISYYRPDLLGMQEVLPNQLADLQERLPQYTPLGVGRDNGKDEGEYNPIFYRRSRFDLVRHGNFPLNESADSFGIKGWDAACNRVCTWAIFKERASGKEVAYFNTHLDHVGATARREGIRLVTAKIKELAPGIPVILTGDFNCRPGEEPMQVLAAEGMKNAYETADISYGPAWSFHGFGGIPVNERPLLDYVFISPQLKATRCRVIEDRPATGYYSDHNPVLAEIAGY